MLYSKNGSIPYSYTDGTEGWIEVPDKPEAPEGKEVVWWYPPGWVIRDPKPADEEGVKWSWNQSTEQWIRYELAAPVEPAAPTEEVIVTNSSTTAETTFATSDNDSTATIFTTSLE